MPTGKLSRSFYCNCDRVFFFLAFPTRFYLCDQIASARFMINSCLCGMNNSLWGRFRRILLGMEWKRHIWYGTIVSIEYSLASVGASPATHNPDSSPIFDSYKHHLMKKRFLLLYYGMDVLQNASEWYLLLTFHANHIDWTTLESDPIYNKNIDGRGGKELLVP